MSKSATLTYTLILRTGFWCTLLADDDGIGRVSYTIWLTSICCSRFCLRLIPERGSVYIVVVFLLMLVLPVVSVVHDRFVLGNQARLSLLLGRCFVFCGCWCEILFCRHQPNCEPQVYGRDDTRP